MNDALYAYSLIPVVSVATLLFSTMLLRGARPAGLTAYCASVALWASFLLLTFVEGAGAFASRSSAFGVFVAASFVHTAFDFTDAPSYRLVWAAYAVAFVLFIVGLVFPGFLFDPTTLAAGPFFWPGMAMAVGAATVPLWHLYRAHRDAEGERRSQLRSLALAGGLGYVGAWCNALMLSHGIVLPWGMLFVLASLLFLAVVVRSTQDRAESRLMERSLTYAAMTAFVSAGFLFGVLTLVEEPASAILAQYRAGALFVLFMAALAIEPFRQSFLEFVGRKVVPNTTNAAELARELGVQEERSHQAQRLAELGVFTSAIAHEVRNPLGVLRANLRLVERTGDADPELLRAMESEIDRASNFLDDLLAYGRPRPLELRAVSLRDTVALAFSTARQALDAAERQLDNRIDDEIVVEVDQAQLSQVFVILFENALLATGSENALYVSAARRHDRVIVAVEDDGPGVPDALRDSLFDPFVTGRKRSETRRGTGLGLAIARGIVERHHGTIVHEAADSGGARFVIDIPRMQNVLAAATDNREDEDE